MIVESFSKKPELAPLEKVSHTYFLTVLGVGAG